MKIKRQVRPIALFCALAAFASSVGSQELGRVLYAQGIRQTVALKDGTGAFLYGTFHPEVPLSGDFFLTRYGLSQRPLGTLRGPEGTSVEDLAELAAAGLLVGLPKAYKPTTTDWVDARMLRYAGQSWWGAVVDPLLAQLHSMGTTEGPNPPACELPKVCMVPPPACPAVVACPPVVACPSCPPPPACPEPPVLSGVPADVRAIAAALKAYIPATRPYQRKQAERLAAWLAGVEAVKAK